jgi:hypothetical protein
LCFFSLLPQLIRYIIKKLTEENKIVFYKLLTLEKSIDDFERFIYTQKDIENQLGKDTFFNLIKLNFKDKYEQAKLVELIKSKIIEEGQFETWKLKTILNDFLSQPKKTDLNLDKIYHLYCGVYQENGARKYEYKFLKNLRLNYLYWANEGYLKTHYGNIWESEYTKYQNEFIFYHEQLKKFATEILLAIDNKDIEILNNGTYKISDDLKSQPESEKIYILMHPNKK